MILRAEHSSLTTSTVPVNKFFPDSSPLSSATPSATSSPTGDTPSSNFAKSALEYIFLALAIFLLICSIWLRLLRVRQANQPCRTFFRFRPSLDRPTSPSSSGPFLRTRPYASPTFGAHTFNPYGIGLAEVPPAHTRRRELRGADIGTGGRRVDAGVSDYNEGDPEKDALPAYSKFGGPPQYADAWPPPIIHTEVSTTEPESSSPVQSEPQSQHSREDPSTTGSAASSPSPATITNS